MVKILADQHRAFSMGRVSRRLAEGHPNQATFDEHERMYQQMVVEHAKDFSETKNISSVETIQEEIDLGFYRPVLIETKLPYRQSNYITRVAFPVNSHYSYSMCKIYSKS